MRAVERYTGKEDRKARSRTYDERMFHRLVARDRWHGGLLGKPAHRLADEDADTPLLGQERLQKLRLNLAPR